jgi:hypothetical protein
MINLVSERLNLGKEKYGHGVRTHMDTTTWGTPKNSWIEMAMEEYLDAIVYTVADYIRKFEEPSQPDDNQRILELTERPEHMLSVCHEKLVNSLKELVNLSLAIK